MKATRTFIAQEYFLEVLSSLLLNSKVWIQYIAICVAPFACSEKRDWGADWRGRRRRSQCECGDWGGGRTGRGCTRDGGRERAHRIRLDLLQSQMRRARREARAHVINSNGALYYSYVVRVHLLVLSTVLVSFEHLYSFTSSSSTLLFTPTYGYSNVFNFLRFGASS